MQQHVTKSGSAKGLAVPRPQLSNTACMPHAPSPGFPELHYFHPDDDFIPYLSAEAVSQRSQPSSTGINHHLQVVVGHHQSGIQGLRAQLSDLSDFNCHEVFAGSLLLVAFAFASLRLRIWGDSHLSVAPLPKLRLD